MEGGQVPLEQTDMHVAFDIAKMAKGGFPPAAIQETQNLKKKPCAKVGWKKKWVVDSAQHG